MKNALHIDKVKIQTVKGGQIYLRRLEPENSKAVVLFLHGLGNNGDTFLKNDRGLANFLYEQGYACYIPDMIGHGESWPHLNQHLDHTVSDILNEDLPRIFHEVSRHLNGRPLLLVGQDFGSTLLMAAYARYPNLRNMVRGFVHFSARRTTAHSDLNRNPIKSIFWQRLLPLFARKSRVVPLNLLSDFNEPENLQWYQRWVAWSNGPWVDDGDNFDYSAAMKTLMLPSSLYIAANQSKYRCDIADARAFMMEQGRHDARLVIVGKRQGNLHQYNDRELLEHRHASKDHFPLILDWLDSCIDVEYQQAI